MSLGSRRSHRVEGLLSPRRGRGIHDQLDRAAEPVAKGTNPMGAGICLLSTGDSSTACPLSAAGQRPGSPPGAPRARELPRQQAKEGNTLLLHLLCMWDLYKLLFLDECASCPYVPSPAAGSAPRRSSQAAAWGPQTSCHLVKSLHKMQPGI